MEAGIPSNAWQPAAQIEKEAAIGTAEELPEVDSRAARWAVSDVIRDVMREKVQAKLR